MPKHLRPLVRTLTVGSLLLLCSSIRARGDVALDDEQKIKLFGDFRFRWEQDWDSRRDDGSLRDDRDRARVRVRLGFKWEPVEHLQFGVRGRTGNTDNQQSPHVTIWQDEGDRGDRDILVDRLWVQGRWEHGQVQAGRIAHPFWRQTEMLFDDDIWIDGLSFGLRFDGGSLQQQVNGAVATVPEGPASLDWEDQGWLYGLQYVATKDCGEGRSFTGAVAGIRIEDEGSVANPVLLDLDWTIWGLGLQGKLRAGSVPVTIGADLFHGADAPPKGTWNRDERDAWGLFVRFGSDKEKGDWLAGLAYAHVEAFAYVPYLAGDDWLRWGSAVQTRVTNYEGLELRAGYAFSKNMNILLRVYFVEGLELLTPTSTSKEDGKKLKLDFNWKF